MGKLWDKIWSLGHRVEDAAVELARDAFPEVEEDSWLDLRGHKLDGVASGQRDREDAPSPAAEGESPKPVYRRDGQVHNFGALPYPGTKRMTRAQYDARYGGRRPVPKRSVRDFSQEVAPPPSAEESEYAALVKEWEKT